MIGVGTELIGDSDQIPGVGMVRTRFFRISLLNLFPQESERVPGRDRRIGVQDRAGVVAAASARISRMRGGLLSHPGTSCRFPTSRQRVRRSDSRLDRGRAATGVPLATGDRGVPVSRRPKTLDAAADLGGAFAAPRR
jgi:hypothetical protein